MYTNFGLNRFVERVYQTLSQHESFRIATKSQERRRLNQVGKLKIKIMAKFIFNRYHLESSEKIDNKLQFISDGLVIKSATSLNKYAYKFIEIEIKNNYIYGYLIKYDPYSIDEVFNEQESKLTTDGIKNKIISKSKFILGPPLK